MRPPRFSIVVASYNQRHFVQVAVESAVSHPHPSKEIIVVDDGSSDGTPEVLDTFGDSIRLVKFPKNQGAPAARNHGSSLATGEYLVFLDGDDVLVPWTLQVYERLIAVKRPKIILGLRFWFQGEVPRAAAEDVPGKIDFVEFACWFQKDRTRFHEKRQNAKTSPRRNISDIKSDNRLPTRATSSPGSCAEEESSLGPQ